MIFDGEIIEKGGHRFRVNIERDDDCDEPWKREDGHGPVSEWTRRDKKPGEWVLNSDRGSKRYYDAHEANEIAKRDGWGLSDKDKQELMLSKFGYPSRYIGIKRLVMPEHARDGYVPFPVAYRELTPGEIRAEAVRRDYEVLRGWCNDQWWYVGVVITHLPDPDDDNEPIDYGHALWGIESNSDDYLEEVAHELIDDKLHELADEAEKARLEEIEAQYWAARGVVTL